jgi:hypothetical protein
MADNILDQIIIDPVGIEDWSKEKLVEAYAMTCEVMESLTTQKDSLRDLLLDKIQGDGEIIGDHAVTKAKRFSWFPGMKPKEKLEKAKEYGAVMEAVDTSTLKKLYLKGVDVPHAISQYVLVKYIVKEDK